MPQKEHFFFSKRKKIGEISLPLHQIYEHNQKNFNMRKLLSIAIALMTIVSCANKQHTSDDSGYNSADSIINAIGDARDFPRLIEVTDSFEKAGDISQVRAIFYSTIAYNLMGKHRTALRRYYQLAKINAKDLDCQADIESMVYTYKDYMRLLCDMRRYDRALREANNADRKLKAAGYDTFTDHHDIAQMMGESQLYLDQEGQAKKSFEKSLQGMKTRLATYDAPLDLRECQKTMNAIARAYIHRGHYDEAIPWMKLQDSLFIVADKHPQRDTAFVDEMKAEINYSKALLEQALGHTDKAEQAFAAYQSTRMAKQLGSIINSNEYLLQTHRYEEAARNYSQLERYLKESGYKADLDNIGRFMIPKYRANLLAGRRDSALYVATLVADYFDSALVRQKISDADLLATVYDTEGKERQIAEQRAELSQVRTIAVVIIMIIVVAFFHFYIRQRRKAYDKLNESNRQLKLANERAEESSRMKTKFIQQISHEVRTPLNILSGFTQVLADPNINVRNEELQTISQKIIENSERITSLVNKMLDLSMVSSGGDIECHDTMTPADVATQAIDQSGIRQADHLDFQLQVSPEAETLFFTTCQESAVKALTLLLDNAIKFTHPTAFRHQQPKSEKARVTLSICATHDQMVFVVEDTGIGIPADQAENIFTEFVQLDDYIEGTGIGLSIARLLARHLNGDITLDTTYTAGARFVMVLQNHLIDSGIA